MRILTRNEAPVYSLALYQEEYVLSKEGDGKLCAWDFINGRCFDKVKQKKTREGPLVVLGNERVLIPGRDGMVSIRKINN